MITTPKLPPQSLIFSSLSFFAATPLAPHASDLDLLLAVNKQIKVLNVKAVTFLLQMVSLPVLLIIILASSVMGRPRAQSLDCIQYCDGQYRMCQSSWDDWHDCVSCTTCNEVCITSCTKHGVVNACRDYLNELGIEQEMEKQSSQLQQEGQDKEKQEISSSEQDDEDYNERGHGL